MPETYKPPGLYRPDLPHHAERALELITVPSEATHSERVRRMAEVARLELVRIQASAAIAHRVGTDPKVMLADLETIRMHVETAILVLHLRLAAVAREGL